MTRILPDRTQGPLSTSGQQPSQSSSPPNTAASDVKPEVYTQPFLSFISNNPTIFHTVAYFSNQLSGYGFTELSERQSWDNVLSLGGKYYFTRNGSSLVAFVIGSSYKSGNGAAMIASHIDALTAKLKPLPKLQTQAGYIQLGVAPYAGGLNSTWFDRDLGIGGRVLVKDGETGIIETRLVKLDWPIARIPTLAPHFGIGMMGESNRETQLVPIVGLDNSDINGQTQDEVGHSSSLLGGAGAFTTTQPARLVQAITSELGIEDHSSIVNWELELFDTQPAQLGGLSKEFIFAPRIDDKLCSFSAIEALIASSTTKCSVPYGGGDKSSSTVRLVSLFDDEEIGSLLRQGAHSNLLPSTISRIVESLSPFSHASADLLARTYANSFLISADVTHAVNPNFLSSYLAEHSPRLNVGVTVQADSNGHTTTDSVSTAILQRVADRCDAKLQVFQIRNDSRSGGTVGPMLSSAMGVRAVDAGLPQLSMHSIRATTGSLDPGLGVRLFKGFFDGFEEVDREFV